MACDEHKMLAQYLKEVHLVLRKSSIEKGPEIAWSEHLENRSVLSTYAQYMKTLATTHWKTDSAKNTSGVVISRIKWTADYCLDYFLKETYLKFRQKDIDIAQKNYIDIETLGDNFSQPVRLLDVGSCFNPFKVYDYFDVFALDLYPANETVMQCDFLDVSIGLETKVVQNKVEQLGQKSFDVVTFCFLLEYLPHSKMRIKACENAYKLLRLEGLLIISTPDSKHVGANSKLMKCWRYTLSWMGFSRIKYEKFRHMHCMAFRKSLHLNIAKRWSTLYKESYMSYAMHIPQDFNTVADDTNVSTPTKSDPTFNHIDELPFFNESEY